MIDVPLNPEDDTAVQVSGDNGSASLTGSVAWLEFDLLNPATNALLLRKNDGLKWNLRPAGQGAALTLSRDIDNRKFFNRP